MMNWHWYWKIKTKHIRRIDCSTLASIDSFKLLKTIGLKGFLVQTLNIKAELHENGLTITYRKRKEHSYFIAIDKQSCRFGGFKSYFKCPLCHARMRFLYLGNQSTFLCRKCLNLTYTSQRLRPSNRYLFMAKKVTDSIKDKNDMEPKNMHTAKYQKIRSLKRFYDQKWSQALNAELRLWYGPKIEPYLDKYFDYAPTKKGEI